MTAPDPGLLLETRDYSFAYAGESEPTIRHVDIRVRAGQRTGIVGESGSGKTTLIRSLLGLVSGRAGGSAQFLGEELLPKGTGVPAWSRALRRSAGFISQNPDTSLPNDWTVDQVWSEPVAIHSAHDFIQQSAGPFHPSMLPGLLRLPDDVRTRRVGTLSGGQKQRVALGRALVLNPSIVFMDEPFSALDPLVQAGIINLLKDRAVFPESLVIVSHDLALVSYLCDFVYVMQAGRVVDSGPVPATFLNPRHEYTKELVEAQG
ncbi:MAG: ATP-binding cassette domain-containing protein [Spirochaetia bacterium]|nr:ATP-binding cassette domain-containing protein [Spirochaetia bacterium]